MGAGGEVVAAPGNSWLGEAAWHRPWRATGVCVPGMYRGPVYAAPALLHAVLCPQGEADATWVFMGWEGVEARRKGVELNAFK